MDEDAVEVIVFYFEEFLVAVRLCLERMLTYLLPDFDLCLLGLAELNVRRGINEGSRFV